MQLRQTAYKLWISDLVNGNYVKQEGEWDPNYVQVREKKVSRINLIGTVVNKFSSEDDSYSTITIDDSTSTIRVKAFREDTSLLKNLQLGHTVLVIGKVREYNGELFIVPEIIKTINNPNWEIARKLELLKVYGKPNILHSKILEVETTNGKSIILSENHKMETEEIVVENVQEDIKENPKQKIHSLVSNSNMIGVKELIEKSELTEEEAENIINELLEEGEIFEPKAGFLKSI